MENRREKYLMLRKIFNQIIDEEVRKLLKKELAGKYEQLTEENGTNGSKVIFFQVNGNMFFFNKYQLISDVEGGNRSIKKVNEINFLKEAPTFIIPDDLGTCTFWLHLERADIEHDDRSYFCKESREKKLLYRVNCEEMLENEEFRQIMTQMITDIATQSMETIQELLQ